MQKFLRIMLLMAFSALSWAANAQNTLTVANGMSTNGYVPVYGYYADAYLRSQIIYPAADIAAATTTAGMTGGSITSMTFYTSEEEVSLSAVFEVRIKEVPLTTLSYFDSLDGAALVYSGTLNVDDYQMVVTFDSAYTYNGGNLLVDFSTASTGNYVTTTFYGLNATGASVQGYSYSGLSSVNATQRDFMPMTTFTFTGGMAVSCAPVQGLTVGDITPSGATMHILDAINSGATYSISYWKEGGNDTLTVVTADTLYTFTGLDASSLYYYTVTAVCSATDQSIAMGGSFATACGGTTCDISITGTDSYGDGWNGNTLLVMQNGVEVGSFTLYGGSVNSATIPVCSGLPVSFKWMTGNYAYEAAFIIADGGGTTVYTCNNGGDLPSGETFFTLSGACPSCMPVANLSAESTATSVTLSWTGSAASYDVYSDSTFVATVTDSSYTFTGLTPLTAYTFGVVANCSADDVSNMTTINTNTGCESGECNIYIYAQDSYGDGWNGNTIDIMQNGIVWASYSMETQNLSSTVIYDTAVVTVCAAMPLSFGWTSGDYAYEASFEIMNAIGVNVYSANGSEMSGDGTFLALSSCTGMPEFDTVTVFDTACDYFWWNLSGNSYTESGVYSVQSGTTINILNLTVNHSVVDSLFVTADGGYSWYGDFYNESGVYYHNSIGENGCDYTEYLFLTINSNDSLAVTFAVNDSTMGYTYPAAGTYYYQEYDNLYVEAFAYDGYQFTNWTVSYYVDGELVTETYYGQNLSWYLWSYYQQLTITANFEPYVAPQYTITTLCDSTMGSVTGGGVYDEGVEAIVTATPNAGYAFSYWTVHYSDYEYDYWVDYDNPLSIYAYQDYTIVAHFEAIPQPIACSGSSCQISIVGYDSYGDGWNGGYLSLMQNNMLVGVMSIDEGSSSTQSFEVCNDYPVDFLWNPGGWDGEVSFNILSAEGVNLLSVSNASSIVSGRVFARMNTVCTNPTVVEVHDTTYITIANADATMGTTYPAPGTYTYIDNENISIESEPYSGYKLDYWVIDYYYDGLPYSDTSYNTGIYSNAGDWHELSPVTFTAHFTTLPNYTVTVNYDATMGSVTGAGVYQEGTEFTLTATPNPGYMFESWEFYLADSSYYGYTTSNPFTYNADQDYVIEAVFFQPDNIEITISVNDSTMGTTSPAPGTYQYTEGNWFEAQAIANSGYRFSGWTLTYYNDSVMETETIHDNYIDWYIYSNWSELLQMHFTANFEAIPTYTVNVTVSDSTMGSAIGGGVYYENEEFTLEAYPNAGYMFDRWEFYTADGSYYGYASSNPFTYYADQNYNIVAVFTVPDTINVTIAVSDSTLGSTYPAPGTYQHVEGNWFEVEAIPNSGYRFSYWLISYYVDGEYQTETDYSSYLDYYIYPNWSELQNMTFTAYFEPLPTYTITAFCDSTMGTVTGSGTYMEGTEFTLTAIPNAGYHFVEWLQYNQYGDYYDSYTYNPLTLNAYDNYYYEAVFEADPQPIACSGTSCFVTVSGYDSYGDGWNGGKLRLIQRDTVVGQMMITDGSFGTQTFELCNDYPVSFWWVGGNWEDEVSFTVTNAAGTTLFSVEDASMVSEDYPLYTFANICTNPTEMHDTVTVIIAVNDSTMGTTYPAPGTYHFLDNEYIDFYPYADSGYVFYGWTASFNFMGQSYVMPMDGSDLGFYASELLQFSPITFTANFEVYVPVYHTITVVANDSTMGTVTGGGVYEQQEAFTLEATPNPGYVFDYWEFYLSDSSYYGWTSDNPFTYYADQDYTIVAYFAPIDTVNVTIAVSDSTMGTTSPAPGTYQYVEGDYFYVEAIPDSGYQFTNWTIGYYVDGEYQTETDYSSVINYYIYSNWSELQNLTFTANFEVHVPSYYTITVLANDSTMGTVTGGGTYLENTDFTVTATPNAGYMFEEWDIYDYYGNWYGWASSNPFTYTADQDYYFVAYFAPIDSVNVTIAVNNATMGTTSPAPGTYQYLTGDTFNATATPASGYIFQNWTVTYSYDSTVVSEYISDNPNLEMTVNSFWSEQQNLTFTANFSAPEPVSITVAVNNSTLGTTTPAPGTYTYYTGDTIYLFAEPYGNNFFDHWTVDYYEDGVAESVTLDDYSMGFLVSSLAELAPLTFTAVFSSTPVGETTDTVVCTFAVNDAALGTTNPAPGTYTYYTGNALHCVAQPNNGCQLDGWSVTLSHDGVTYLDTTYYYPVADFFDLFGGWIVEYGENGYNWNVTAIFSGIVIVEPDSADITLAVNNADWGTTNPATGTYRYAAGETFSATASPAEGYTFVGWTVTRTLDGESVSDTIADNHIELTVGDDDLTVTAIFAVTPVGIDAVDLTDITVYSSEGRIIVLGAEGRKVVLYDVTGRVLNTKANADEKVEFNVPASGVYLVKAGSAPARRVVVVK